MRYFSTKNKQESVSFKEAIFKGLPDDNGLFVPEYIPKLGEEWARNLPNYSLQEIACTITKPFVDGEISDSEVETIIAGAIDFPAPVISLNNDMAILELFHGPSLAFKDFGARFMAAMMGHFLVKQSKEITILVATSGDTGGAVAYGFLNVPGIKVVILYPSGKVSKLQELQLTTLGSNITALEVAGTFDDCQAMVKQAFLDKTLLDKMNLSSANSINIARLIPQSFYYAEAYKQVAHLGCDIVFCVPSGNFGNLTAGLYAREMGVPIKHFIAATNANSVFPEYINSGVYSPKPSVATLSNAMDVGNPSNFYRILDLYGSTWNIVKDHVSSVSVSDSDTLVAMKSVFDRYGYTLDPHTAVAYLACKAWQNKYGNSYGVLLETAHPAKFLDVMVMSGISNVPIPARLAALQDREKLAIPIANEYHALRDYLHSTY
jgi:threonine synthase